MKSCRFLFVAALIALVLGCTPRLPIGTLDDLSQDQAIVVIGVKAIGGYKRHLSTSWRKYDATTNKIIHEFDLTKRIETTQGNYWNAKQKYGKLNYTISKIIGGKYHLYEVSFFDDRLNLVKREYPEKSISKIHYKGKPDKSRFWEATMTGQLTSGMEYSYSFRVDPGEIIYIGDFIIDVSSFPVKSIRIENNLEQARRAPDLDPTMISLLKFRAPRDLAVTTQGSRQ